MTDTRALKGVQAAHAEARRQAAEQRRYRRTVRLVQIMLVIVLVAVWQFGGGIVLDPLYVGSPAGIVLMLKQNLADPSFYNDLAVTGAEMIMGYCLGAVLGVLTGATFARWRFTADVFDPFFVAFNSIPRIALAPLIIIWFGIDLSSKVVLAATLVYFMTFYNTLAGIRGVDESIVNVSRVMGASHWQIFLKVQLPGALDWIMSGLRLSLPFALIGVIVGEFLAASSGVGYRLNMYSTTYKPDGVFAMLFVLMIAMMALNGLIGWIEMKAMGRRIAAPDGIEVAS